MNACAEPLCSVPAEPYDWQLSHLAPSAILRVMVTFSPLVKFGRKGRWHQTKRPAVIAA